MEDETAAPVDVGTLDLPLAALFVGYALADEVADGIRAAGHPDLRFSHGFVFQHLVSGPATVSDLARAHGVTTQAISQRLRELEDLGYVERGRDPADRRVRQVRLTPRGRDAVVAGRQAREQVARRVAACIGDERVEAATEVLRDILAVLGADTAIAARRVRPPA